VSDGRESSPDGSILKSGTVARMQIAPRYDGPPIISIDGRPDDQRAPLVRQRRRFETMLSKLDNDDWSAPSRCAGWTVQDVVAHIVGVNAFWRASVLAGLAGKPTRVLVGFDPATTPPLMVAPMRSLAPAAVLDQFVASNDGLLEALADLDAAAWSTLAESPPGHVPIRLLAQHALWDCWIHERDVALPLELTPEVEADEVRSGLQYVAALSPAFEILSGSTEPRAYAIAASSPDCSFTLEVGDSVVVHDGPAPLDAPCLRGDAVELVEALSLRSPLPAAAPVEWRQLRNGLAAAFDSDLETV
jgi:uncharacterized protein (TIGR03083 family)